MPKQNRTGEAKKHTESGAKAKGGEEMTREDVVKAALTLERWCAEHKQTCEGCPFDDKQDNMCAFRIPPADVLVEEYIKNWEAAEMTREEQIALVVDFLETAYTGARAMDEVEVAARLERAIAVMKTPSEIEVFRPDFEEIYIEREVLKELEAAKK